MEIKSNLVILTFDRTEQEYEFNCALKGMDYKFALQDIANEVFRPARKHGYGDSEIQSCIETINKKLDDTDYVERLVALLEQKFYDILNERNLNIHD